MHNVFLSLLLLAMCFLCVLAVHQNTKASTYRIHEKFAAEDDGALDDREAREFDSNLDFVDDKTKDDQDLYFAQEDEGDKWINKKSVDYSEWKKKNEFKVNDDKKEVEEEKGLLRKLIQKFKNMLHKIGKRR